jgi:hypothetical protein
VIFWAREDQRESRKLAVWSLGPEEDDQWPTLVSSHGGSRRQGKSLARSH